MWDQNLALKTGISYTNLFEVTNMVKTYTMGINKGYLDSVKAKFQGNTYLRVGQIPIKFSTIPKPSKTEKEF